jgi:hypothetical protein
MERAFPGQAGSVVTVGRIARANKGFAEISDRFAGRAEPPGAHRRRWPASNAPTGGRFYP